MNIMKLLFKWYIAIPLIIILTPIIILLINPNASSENVGELIALLIIVILLEKFFKWNKREQEERKLKEKNKK